MNNTYGIDLNQGERAGSVPCWRISNDDKLRALNDGTPFSDRDQTDCYFKITNKIDNVFIEGHLGNISDAKVFHDRILNNYTYFKDYENREKVYFSFDKISLYLLTGILYSNPLTFILKRIELPAPIIANQVFMIMPFGVENLNHFYFEHIHKYLLSELNIKIYRADHFCDNDIIIDTIYRQIENSEFIIVDTTYANKNVFLEYGYAIAKQKEIITIQDKTIEPQILFDRAHFRAILYSLENITGFQTELKRTISEIKKKIVI